MTGRIEILPVVRAEGGEGGLGIASIEAWPAAGGGLLVGAAEPEFAGLAPLRRAVKTVFIRICTGGKVTLLLPYVSLEPEALRCVRALVAFELAMPEERIASIVEGGRHRIIDIGAAGERSLQACAAVTRSLLAAAAVESGIVGPGAAQTVPLGELAADAALIEVPDAVQLLSGRSLSLGAPSTSRTQARRFAVPEANRHSHHAPRIQP